mmetsp:Transcript_18132/g.30976  ORF Transcript_18132/g.30976 Transcript_18132/m.30976 type:complete len:332 (-) Transcript_18132:50-1045(-)
MLIIKGLLKALQVAHLDKNTILFERIKTVLTLIARGGSSQINGEGQQDEEERAELNKERKMLMTEVVALVLKPTKDQKMHQAYQDCLVALTKLFGDSKDKQLKKFVALTYKELFSKFLGGRGAPSHCLNQQFFNRIFDECDSSLGKSLIKPLLKYFLPSAHYTSSRKDSIESFSKELGGAGGLDSEMSNAENGGAKSGKSQDKSRSNNQRLKAFEIFSSLVKQAQKNPQLLKMLAQNIDLISQVIVLVVRTSDSFQQKKSKKTMLCVNIFTKLGKTVVLSKDALDPKLKAETLRKLGEHGVRVIKQIEAECEKDKNMSNLKGKIKEIKSFI